MGIEVAAAHQNLQAERRAPCFPSYRPEKNMVPVISKWTLRPENLGKNGQPLFQSPTGKPPRHRIFYFLGLS
jgi:hypothetical protein